MTAIQYERKLCFYVVITTVGNFINIHVAITITIIVVIISPQNLKTNPSSPCPSSLAAQQQLLGLSSNQDSRKVMEQMLRV